jgi:hypothetical protein
VIKLNTCLLSVPRFVTLYSILDKKWMLDPYTITPFLITFVILHKSVMRHWSDCTRLEPALGYATNVEKHNCDIQIKQAPDL